MARSDVFEVTMETAHRRCDRCRRKHSVHIGAPMYSLRDKLEEATYCWWSFVHGASLTFTALHLGRKEDVVRRHYHHAAAICAHDAERRQARVVFGRRYPFTTILETDETRIGKFKVTIDDVRYHYHLVLLGVEVRGQPSSIWLLLVGLTCSRDVGRVPPLKHYIWRMVSRTLFDADTHAVNMTDGCFAYRQDTLGIVFASRIPPRPIRAQRPGPRDQRRFGKPANKSLKCNRKVNGVSTGRQG